MVYLGYQVSYGRTISFGVTGTSDGAHMCPEVAKEMEGLVRDLTVMLTSSRSMQWSGEV